MSVAIGDSVVCQVTIPDDMKMGASASCSMAGCRGACGICKPVEAAPIRRFETGATRDTDEGKYDYEGFLSPLVLERFAEYMHKHRMQADGNLRDSDNWQKGIPLSAYIKSLWRHFHDLWKLHRGYRTRSGANIEEACCAILFNTQGYLLEHLKQKQGK